jgi:hypothetical protein
LKRYKKIIFALLILGLVLGVFTFLSYSEAKKKAEDIIRPVNDELQLVSCTLSPFHFKNGEFQNKITGIGWRVAFNTDQYFIIHDIEIYVSLIGVVEMTNPKDLQERIIKKINK